MQGTWIRRSVALGAVGALASGGVVLSTTWVAEASTVSLSNPSAITINDDSAASPYPSAISVSGASGAISQVTVTLTGLSHEDLRDVGVVLVAPDGDALELMAGVGHVCCVATTNVNLTFADTASSQLSDSANPVSGTYKPASYLVDTFPAPGPGGAYAQPAPQGTATLASAFAGDDPNGTWQLFVADFAEDFAGSISGGWSLGITTTGLLQDGGFEAGASGDSPSWSETDSKFGTPLCTVPSCGGVGPHSGSVWAWFGGVTQAGTASLTQSVTIPDGAATLSYFLRISSAPAPAAATLVVKLDMQVLHTYADVSELGWRPRTVDVSEFADGGSHTLSFSYVNPSDVPGAVPPNFHLDDVSLTAGPPGSSTTPAVTAVVPAGPSSSPSPLVHGTSEPGSTVTLYPNDACSGEPWGIGSAADFSGPGIPTLVLADDTTTIYARASQAGKLDSACSSTHVSYTHDDIAPDAPTGLGVSPASPSTDPLPTVTGTAEAGSNVSLYGAAGCPDSSGLAQGTTDLFGSDGFTVLLGSDGTTTFSATATDAAGNVSACSSSVSYTLDTTAPAPPSGLSVSRASPNASTSPVVKGTAEAGSTVKLYANAACTGTPTATGVAATFASPGFAAAVAPGSTTSFTATATDGLDHTSACSSPVTYTEQNPGPNPAPSAPETTLTKTPKKTVKTATRKAKVVFGFASAAAGATFECSIDGKAFRACASPTTFKAALGKHLFAVRAVVGGGFDQTPATFAFKVKKKASHARAGVPQGRDGKDLS